MQLATGILELANTTSTRPDGRLRSLVETYNGSPTDPVVPAHLIEQLNLRPGVELEVQLGKQVGGNAQQNNNNGGGGGGKRSRRRRNKGGGGGGGGGGSHRSMTQLIDPKAHRVEAVNTVEGMTPEEWKSVPAYDELTPIDPQPRLTLEYPGCPPSCRLIDLFCPIGYGTRGMIVSPPKAGKTTLLQNIAFAVEKNHPEIETVALLVDERPEEVTDFRRNVPCHVWASSNDHTAERHVHLAMLAIDRCKRWVEMGKDVVVVMDSLTRIGRAFNVAPGMSRTGRTQSGGLDAGALAIPKQLFGAARKFEGHGSLTIIATALVDTGSQADTVIFEEFKGTGNMELILDRKIAEQRVFPAIDLAASGTRKEDKLMTDHELSTVTALRRRLLNMQPVMQVQQLLRAVERFETNAILVGNPSNPNQPQASPAMRFG